MDVLLFAPKVIAAPRCLYVSTNCLDYWALHLVYGKYEDDAKNADLYQIRRQHGGSFAFYSSQGDWRFDTSPLGERRVLVEEIHDGIRAHSVIPRQIVLSLESVNNDATTKSKTNEEVSRTFVEHVLKALEKDRVIRTGATENVKNELAK